MMNKKNWILAGAFVLVFLAGWFLARMGGTSSAPALAQNTETPAGSDSLLVVDMQDADEPEGVVAVLEPKYVDDSQIPSQLSKIKVQGIDRVVSRTGDSIDAPSQDDSAVMLGDVERTRIQSGVAPVSPRNEDDSKISMIEAPVQAKVIKNLEEYKKFKRTARGKYPEANFAKDYVVVLESTSNLPDKVFEIQDVQENDGKMLVIYRVNIFGLDKKTNTHSAVRIDKTDLPIELKQVL